MDVYAVLDLKAGQVVHAVAGDRDGYLPIRSDLVRSSEPHLVARAMVDRCGIQNAYVADLDAIGGQPPDLAAIRSVAAAGMGLILDVGIGTTEQAKSLLDQLAHQIPLRGLVVPLESATSARDWPALVKLIGAQRAVFSLDLKAGRPLTSEARLAQKTPLEIGSLAWNAGFRRVIILDLQSVGTRRGPSTLGLCSALSAQHPWPELISGGGVRDGNDLEALAQAGCHSALIASALHRADGREWVRE